MSFTYLLTLYPSPSLPSFPTIICMFLTYHLLHSVGSSPPFLGCRGGGCRVGAWFPVGQRDYIHWTMLGTWKKERSQGRKKKMKIPSITFRKIQYSCLGLCRRQKSYMLLFTFSGAPGVPDHDVAITTSRDKHSWKRMCMWKETQLVTRECFPWAYRFKQLLWQRYLQGSSVLTSTVFTLPVWALNVVRSAPSITSHRRTLVSPEAVT